MPRKAPKMTDLVIEETSGVDHPAHLHEGWLVMKTASPETVAEVSRNLPSPMEENMEKETTDVVEELKADETVEAMYGEDEMKDAEDDLAVAQARISELEARIAELESSSDEEMEMELAAEEVVEGAEELDKETLELAKAAPEEMRGAIVKMFREKAVAEKALHDERELHADAEATLKAKSTFGHLNIEADKIGPALRRLSNMDSELAKSVTDALLAADAQNESADIFSEVGKGFTVKGDAIDKMTSLAKAAVADGTASTIEQGYALVASTNPALYNDYLTEKGS